MKCVVFKNKSILKPWRNILGTQEDEREETKQTQRLTPWEFKFYKNLKRINQNYPAISDAS